LSRLEPRTHNSLVAGSSPASPTTIIHRPTRGGSPGALDPTSRSSPPGFSHPSPRPEALAGEARDRLGHFLQLLLHRLVRSAGGLHHAVGHVLLQQHQAHPLERGLQCRDLGEHVDAVFLLGDHPLHTAHLAFDALHARDQLGTVAVATQRLLAVINLAVGRRLTFLWRMTVALVCCLRSIHGDYLSSTSGWMDLKPRSRRLLDTTNTLDSAIAAPASIGFSRPKAASGIAATL